jgi:undecaprenyl diphosphate synthase
MINHLAFIMDGNRRWAKKRSLVPWKGHQKGSETAENIIKYCIDKNIAHLSLYTFSLENFKRPNVEKHYLLKLILSLCTDSSDTFVKHNVCVKFVGDMARFSKDIQRACAELEDKTSSCSQLSLYILLGYGGTQDILHGVNQIIKDAHKYKDKTISYDDFTQYMWSKNIPPIDLIIRTGGFQRISNFLLLQSAYSELYFTDCLWPDLTDTEIDKALSHFNAQKRNFGS